MRAGSWGALGAVLLAAGSAQGAGLEKAVMWSGEYGGLGGAAVSLVEGSQAIYFNPAGLAVPNGHWRGWDTGARFVEVSLNFSPTISEFKGPIGSTDRSTSEIGFSPVFGGTVSAYPIPRLGVGLGFFVTGGTQATFENQDFSSFNPNFDSLRPDIESDLSVIEGSIGAGYELIDGLRIGAAWRIAWVRARLQSAAPVPNPLNPAGPAAALLAVDLDDLNDVQFEGFRVGLQYAPRYLPFGVGINWRTPVDFEADGKARFRVESGLGGDATDLPEDNDARARAEFPSQIAVGGWVSLLGKQVRIVGEYAFTHYKVDDRIEIDARTTAPLGPGGASAPVDIPDIELQWANQHNIRAGVEWAPVNDWVVRAAYVATSQVTNTDFARASIASPGWGNTFTAGFSTAAAAEWLRLDFAAEYSFANGDGTNELGLSGKFSTWGFAAHLGATAQF